jgi:UDP-glucuronate decarboxylase
MATAEEFTGRVIIRNPGDFTILQLAEKVIALSGSRSSIVKRPLPSDDPMQRKPDLALARQHLQWEPTTALEPGLRRTIDCFAAQLARA